MKTYLITQIINNTINNKINNNINNNINNKIMIYLYRTGDNYSLIDIYINIILNYF